MASTIHLTLSLADARLVLATFGVVQDEYTEPHLGNMGAHGIECRNNAKRLEEIRGTIATAMRAALA